MAIDGCSIDHLPPVRGDWPSLRVIENRRWRRQFFSVTRISGDAPPRRLAVGKETLHDHSSAIWLPLRTGRPAILPGKLKNFHPLVVDVQHPELVTSQPIAGVRNETAIRRYAGQTIVHLPCA